MEPALVLSTIEPLDADTASDQVCAVASWVLRLLAWDWFTATVTAATLMPEASLMKAPPLPVLRARLATLISSASVPLPIAPLEPAAT